VKAALHEVMYAETRERAREAITRFASEYGAKYPKAPTTLEKDAGPLLTFLDFPAQHWKHPRTSNVIESPFATVRLRQRVTKGARSRTKGLLMAYKLLRGRGAAAREQGPPGERTGGLNPPGHPSTKADPCPS
jgi:putative transposase